LAKDQTSQQRAHDEVATVVGAGPLTAGHLDRLLFCRQVISEAMRLYPAAPGIGRLPNAPMVLGGAQISARARIHIPIFALHRNTQLWENPNAFDPDRFAADKVKARSRYAFLPFGGGPRVCIGASFATIEAAAILAVLIRAFRFLPVAGHKPRPVARVTLRPAGGMPILVAARAEEPLANRVFSEARKAS
jgi:cytochrome P450